MNVSASRCVTTVDMVLEDQLIGGASPKRRGPRRESSVTEMRRAEHRGDERANSLSHAVHTDLYTEARRLNRYERPPHGQ